MRTNARARTHGAPETWRNRSQLTKLRLASSSGLRRSLFVHISAPTQIGRLRALARLGQLGVWPPAMNLDQPGAEMEGRTRTRTPPRMYATRRMGLSVSRVNQSTSDSAFRLALDAHALAGVAWQTQSRGRSLPHATRWEASRGGPNTGPNGRRLIPDRIPLGADGRLSNNGTAVLSTLPLRCLTPTHRRRSSPASLCPRLFWTPGR
jgi:hypothetical protein